MSEIANSFKADTLSIQEFFGTSNFGYYIPIYQRAYSWNAENLEQLMVDICIGVSDWMSKPDTTHFLGTLILIDVKPEQIEKRPAASVFPNNIRKVIDGQQRISSLALLACQIYRELHSVKQGFPAGPDYSELFVAISQWQKQFENMFSFDLFKGSPTRKPIILREESDYWAQINASASSYQSEVASFLSDYISAINQNRATPNFPKIPSSQPLNPNLRQIDVWLNKVKNAHISDEDGGMRFPPAWEILEKTPQGKLWDYERPNIISVVANRSNPITPHESQICSIVQYLAFCYYLLNCCGFTVILPTTEDRAFDMFQSLNATGTPLTAIETFKPLVTRSAETLPTGYPGSEFEQHYQHVDELFGAKTKVSNKKTRTNDYLTAYALVYNGDKLPSQFSKQRFWLTQTFNACSKLSDKVEYVHRMGDLAIYWDKVLGFDAARQKTLPGIETTPGNDEAALCVLYLNDAGHTMANSILGRFYSQILRQKPGGESEFVQACKAVAAFFTLWRAALPNTGLDDIYRKLLATQMSWEKGDANLTVANLKAYLLQSLTNKNVGTKQYWISKARQDLRYELVSTVCKFALFVAAHDTIPSVQEPGLMKIAASKTDIHLLPGLWESADFKSIEHVAPQKPNPNSKWSSDIYLNGDEQRIGNLILLPTEINSTVGNKPWTEKWIYYQFLAEQDLAKQQSLRNLASSLGLTLSDKKIDLLTKAGHQSHIKAIVALGQNGCWDRPIIEKRTERICDILWERMIAWLQ